MIPVYCLPFASEGANRRRSNRRDIMTELKSTFSEPNSTRSPGHSEPPGDRSALPSFLPVLLVLFFSGGCAALIYEIVWFQLLQLVIGSSSVSLGVLLGTFMGGMCLGSLAFPRLVSSTRHPLCVYALLELGIGAIGVAVLFLLPRLVPIYTSHASPGLTGILLRGAVSAVCLLPPTILMGATLPAIARWIEATPRGVSWLGFFYGGNTAGAVFGCLLAGFYLLRVHDMATATYVAATINVAVSTIAFSLAASKERTRSAVNADLISARPAPGSWIVYVVIALSGFCALGAEVVWTRLLSLLLGGTVYTFSIILAVFLVGLGMGSSAGSLLARGSVRPRLALGWCQMFLAAAIAWSAYMIAKSLPYWPVNPSLSRSPWISFQLDLLRCLWAILPPACLWGASFPLALAAVAARGNDPGRLVGGVYAANTVGAIVGAISFSMLMIAAAGTQQAQRVLIGLSVLGGLLMLAPLLGLGRTTADAPGRAWPRGFKIATMAAIVICTGLAGALIGALPKTPWGLVAYGRNLPTRDGQGLIVYMGEGMNSSVAVSELDNGVRNFHVSGKIEASTEPQDMRLQRMLGHLPALLHPKPKSVLIVGCGAGVTAGSFVLHPDIERIVICEIEPLIPEVVAQYFQKENYDVIHDPRVQLIFDDARHFVLTTREKFDIITSDPIHPWVKGAATLYTKEYFELVRQHLNRGGIITQWVPLYESTRDVVKSEIATFIDVFQHGTIWSNDDEGKGYDVVLLGQTEPTRINVDELQTRWSRPDHSEVARSLKEVGFSGALQLLATYAGRGTDLTSWLKNAEINRDRNLRLQYLAGMGLNLYQEATIYDEMLAYRKYPEDLFIGSELPKLALKKSLGELSAGE